MAKQTKLVEFVDRDSSVITIKVLGLVEEYRSLKFFDFTSARKMMTRVVQNVQTGKIIAISKGADQAILSRCIPEGCLRQNNGVRKAKDQGLTNLFNQEETSVVERIEEFAAKGFRTLTFAMKELDIQSPDQIDGVLTQEDIESCFSLLGASCVEDLLQKDVSRCLRDFKQAKIQTWMLTGDKGKTARMIGIQCGMFNSRASSGQAKDGELGTEDIVEETNQNKQTEAALRTVRGG